MKLLSSLFFPAYGALWRAAEPFLRRHKRLAEGFEQRLAPASWPGPLPGGPFGQPYRADPGTTTGRPLPGDAPEPLPGEPLPGPASAPANTGPTRLWIQAASGGEARLVQALLPALRASLGPVSLLCTSCTRQGLDILEGLTLPKDSELVSAFFPLDRPDLMDKALTQAAPDALILLETELWPGLMRAVKKRRLPLLVLNGRMTPKSRRAYGLAAPLWPDLAPDRVLAVSPDDAGRFASLFGPACAVSVIPNIKFDLAGAFARNALEQYPEQEQGGSLRRHLGFEGGGLLLLFASVRQEEEKILLPLLKALHGKKFSGAPLALALAPRHLHRLEAWRAALEAAGLPCAALSTAREASPRAGQAPPVLLQDRFGELQSLYGAADAAFVGGSLAPLGGQNFLEPLSQGLSPFVGPWVENFAWTGREIFAQKLVRQTADAQSLLASLEEELERLAAQNAASADADTARRERRRRIRESFTAFLAPRLGGAEQAAQAVALALGAAHTKALLPADCVTKLFYSGRVP